MDVGLAERVRWRLWVRHGVTRSVIIGPKRAYKFPSVRNGWRLFLCGLLANLSEKEWGNYLDSPIPPNTPLFVMPGGWLLVAPRAQPFNGDWEALDWSPWGDRKRANLGVVDGRVVVIDFDMSGRRPPS